MNDDGDHKIARLDDHRKSSIGVCMMTLPPPAEQPEGPFTVTIADRNGKLFEVTFPDYLGQIPDDQAVLGTTGCYELLANLLTGTMRIYLGAK